MPTKLFCNIAKKKKVATLLIFVPFTSIKLVPTSWLFAKSQRGLLPWSFHRNVSIVRNVVKNSNMTFCFLENHLLYIQPETNITLNKQSIDLFLRLSEMVNLISAVNFNRSLREGVKYYFADFVRKGVTPPPQLFGREI